MDYFIRSLPLLGTENELSRPYVPFEVALQRQLADGELELEEGFLRGGGHTGSSGEEEELEAGGLEAAEIGIQRGKRKTGADGEGGEVGIHPDLGRCGRDGGKFEPQLAGALGLGIEAADAGFSAPDVKGFDGGGIG